MTSTFDTPSAHPAPLSAWDRWRLRAGVLGAPAAGGALLLTGDGGAASRCGALFAAVAILWITEALPIAATALLAVAAAPLLSLSTPKEAFAALGNPVLFLFVGSFMLAEGMRIHGLGARLARALTRISSTPAGGLMAASCAALVLSMWISNAAATAIVLPIGLSLARVVDDKRYSGAIVLAIAWGASMGGLATPVGTPPNLIGLRALADAGHPIGFFRWMQLGLPLGVVMLVVMWAVLFAMFRLPLRRGARVTLADEPSTPWTRGELACAFAFAFAVFFWVLPGLLDLMGSSDAAWWKAHMPEEVTAVLSAAILFAWPIQQAGEEPRRALTWDDAAAIDWGTVMLFGGGILLGDLANKTGLAASWGQALTDATGAQSLWAITCLVAVISLLLSEVASNTASATLMVPMAMALAQSAGVSFVPPVLGATIGASFGFMMPISTAPNAMAWGTRMVQLRDMVRAGVIFDACGLVAALIALRVLCPLLGLDG